MIDFNPWLKVTHVLLAIVAVGSNLTYGIWLARASSRREHLGWTLRGIKILDDGSRTRPTSAWASSAC